MLVLTRRKEEVIYIGVGTDTVIRIKVVDLQRGAKGGLSRVLLGIEAPKHVGIWREELLERAVKDAEAQG